MTREEAREYFEHHIRFYCVTGVCREAEEMAIAALEAEPCEDAISRAEVHDLLATWLSDKLDEKTREVLEVIDGKVEDMSSVTPKQRTGHCKDCKYFEYDSVAKVEGIPLIVAHEICSRWGNGCKTKEDGYCFLFEPQEIGRKCHTCKHYTSGENDGSCGSYICKGYSNWESEE